MADRLSASQMADFSGQNIRNKVTRTATIDNDAITATDITSRVLSWGDLKFSVYNAHPNRRGRLEFPVVTVEVDNSDGYFDFGGTAFPNGSSDLETTTLRIQVVIDGTTFIDFTGEVRQPEFNSGKILGLVAEHPLTQIGQRKWLRSDRIGGDTGIDMSFDA